ncbi:MAG: phage head closure protein [Clostridia bacterium]|nr:phage head closure protein [Clostridia bacterium]
MFIDELRHRVSILEFVEVRDEYGGVEGTWQEVAKRWCKIDQIGGSETQDNQQVKAVVSTKITMRYMEGLSEKNRIKYKNSIYEITSVVNVLTGNHTMILDCKELKDGVI